MRTEYQGRAGFDGRPGGPGGRGFGRGARVPGRRRVDHTAQTVVWALWFALLLLVIPALAEAQVCAELAPGDPVRIQLPSGPSRGTLVAMTGRGMTVELEGDRRTLLPGGGMETAEVRCRLTKPRGPGILNAAMWGGLLGGMGGWLVGQTMKEDVAPPREECTVRRTSGGLGSLTGFGGYTTVCRTVRPPPATSPVNFGKGFVVGAGVGALWALLRRSDRDWVPVSGTGLGAAEPVVRPTPGEPGAWSLGLRVSLGGTP